MKIEVVENPDMSIKPDGRFMSRSDQDPYLCVGCGQYERSHEWRCKAGHLLPNDERGMPRQPFPCGEIMCGHEAWLCCPQPN